MTILDIDRVTVGRLARLHAQEDIPGNPANTKHLYNICTMLGQRRRRWTDVVQMLYKCFVFAGNEVTTIYTLGWVTSPQVDLAHTKYFWYENLRLTTTFSIVSITK